MMKESGHPWWHSNLALERLHCHGSKITKVTFSYQKNAGLTVSKEAAITGGGGRQHAARRGWAGWGGCREAWAVAVVCYCQPSEEEKDAQGVSIEGCMEKMQ